MVYTLQFNLVEMINYFGYESKAKLNIGLVGDVLEWLQPLVNKLKSN